MIFALYLIIGFYRCKLAIDAYYDVRKDLINQAGDLNQRDINNGYYNWAIRHVMYDYVPYRNIVNFKSLMTWWNYKTTKEANLALWSDLRFIDPDYNCDQLTQLIKMETSLTEIAQLEVSFHLPAHEENQKKGGNVIS